MKIHNERSENYRKDFTSLLTLNDNDFITAVYRELLEREPDSENFADYFHFICQGIPCEAVIYQIAVSQEFTGRFKIKQLDNYKRIYKKYILKSEIKKLPVIRRYS